MSRHIKCDGCPREEILRPGHNILETRAEASDGTVRVAELCGKCRREIFTVFPTIEDELNVPGFLQPEPEDAEDVEEMSWRTATLTSEAPEA